jgi:hypothetical protein
MYLFYRAFRIISFSLEQMRDTVMPINTRLRTKDIALMICFTALYAVFASIPIFQLLGMPSRSITAAAVAAPVIGVLLGPYVGAVSAVLGGTIGFFAGSFAPWNFVAGVVTTLCAGLLYKGKQLWCSLIYASFLVVFGFYPSIGPAWLFPLSMWFQIVCLLVLVSPLQLIAVRKIKSSNGPSLALSFFAVSLTSTLAGQISGSLTYMLLIPSPLGGWLLIWQGLTIVYPIERITIALGSALTGSLLLKALRSSNLIPFFSREGKQETLSAKAV